ncbi:hypothetical protein LZ30DRAFT_689745 [Colletotrichum cereale]|nr:hypothetical protein LZ30DRAFT_689745 [Colletotrichum cereale]
MKFTLITPLILALAGSLALANPLPQMGPPACLAKCDKECSGKGLAAGVVATAHLSKIKRRLRVIIQVVSLLSFRFTKLFWSYSSVYALLVGPLSAAAVSLMALSASLSNVLAPFLSAGPPLTAVYFALEKGIANTSTSQLHIPCLLAYLDVGSRVSGYAIYRRLERNKDIGLFAYECQRICSANGSNKSKSKGRYFELHVYRKVYTLKKSRDSLLLLHLSSFWFMRYIQRTGLLRTA